MKASIGQLLLMFCLANFLLLTSTPVAEAKSEGRLSFAQALEAAGEYQLALLEYKRFLNGPRPNMPIATALLGSARCYLELGEWARGEATLQQLLDNHSTAPESVTATLLSADIPFFRGNFSLARSNYRQLQQAWSEAGRDADEVNWRIAWSYIEEGKLGPARHTLNRLPSSNARILSEELFRLEERPRYTPGLAGTFSAILPGAGQLYTGHPRSAGLAFLLNAAFIAASLEAFDRDLPVLGGILLAIELGWYGGNIYNAVNLAERNNRVSLEKGRRELRRRFGLAFGVDNRSGWVQLQGHF